MTRNGQKFPLLLLTMGLMSLTWSGPSVLAQTNPAPSVMINGEGPDDDFGWSVAPAGDVNGDGVADVIVGAPSNDAVAGFSGRAYLFYGPLPATLNAASADAIVSAQAFGDNLGFSVAGAGDVNGDGFDDVLIGARSNDTPGIQSGQVYLFLGPLQGNLAATSANAIISGSDFEELGRAVAGAGDVNGDGFADILLGTDLGGASDEGRAYLFYGPLTGNRTAASADAIVSGTFANESFGDSVAGVGDVNQDGHDDILVGAPRFPLNGVGTGRAYLFHGPLTGAISAASANAILFGEANNDSFGSSVAAAGDVNGDGIPDLIVGAEQIFTSSGPGKAYVFHGPTLGSIQAANADAILVGEAAKNLFGTSVAGGDTDGDAFSDVVVGAWDNGGGGVRSGRAYVFQGPLVGTLSAAAADLIVTGAPGDEVGHCVAAGDLDGDGTSDVLVGAPQFTDGAAGYAALFLSGGSTVPSDLELTVTPQNPPIQIPPTGGTLRYTVKLVNEGTVSRTVNIWDVLTGPGGTTTFAPITRTLAPGATFRRTVKLRIPASLAAGTYTLTGNAGAFPAAEVSASFTFTKL